jgi:hypothetical protein
MTQCLEVLTDFNSVASSGQIPCNTNRRASLPLRIRAIVSSRNLHSLHPNHRIFNFKET